MRKLTVKIINRGPLSPKEAIVLEYLCQGYMRKEIAEKVHRTPSTVGKQIESILEKLECHCAAEVVATVVAAGMVKMTISNEHSLFMKFVCALMLVNITASHMDLRRGPQSPRPQRTYRASSRVVRRIEQS